MKTYLKLKTFIITLTSLAPWTKPDRLRSVFKKTVLVFRR